MLDAIARYCGYSGGGEFNSNPYFPYIDHIAPATMLLADNSVMAVLRGPGAPFKLLANAQRDGLKHRLTAFLNAASGNKNVELHIHLTKHDAELQADCYAPPLAPYAKMILADYHASIADELAVVESI